MSGQVCAGCGEELPSRARKWCSERCRKGSYGDPCVRCGARTTYGAEHARVDEPHCARCENERRTAERDERVAEIVHYRAAGWSDAAIATALDTSTQAIRTLVYRARNRGVAVPLTRYAPARGRGLKDRAVA